MHVNNYQFTFSFRGTLPRCLLHNCDTSVLFTLCGRRITCLHSLWLRSFLSTCVTDPSRTKSDRKQDNPRINCRATACGITWKTTQMATANKGVSQEYWEQVFSEAPIKTLQYTATNATPHEKFHSFLPSWLSKLGIISIKRNTYVKKRKKKKTRTASGARWSQPQVSLLRRPRRYSRYQTWHRQGTKQEPRAYRKANPRIYSGTFRVTLKIGNQEGYEEALSFGHFCDDEPVVA